MPCFGHYPIQICRRFVQIHQRNVRIPKHHFPDTYHQTVPFYVMVQYKPLHRICVHIPIHRVPRRIDFINRRILRINHTFPDTRNHKQKKCRQHNRNTNQYVFAFVIFHIVKSDACCHFHLYNHTPFTICKFGLPSPNLQIENFNIQPFHQCLRICALAQICRVKL